jgi:hypothetical protein
LSARLAVTLTASEFKINTEDGHLSHTTEAVGSSEAAGRAGRSRYLVIEPGR